MIDSAACTALLLGSGVNPASTIEYEVNGTIRPITLQWIIDAFMQGSDETKTLFFTSLKKITETKNPLALKEYFENMGKLLILSGATV